ncbi:hypothetical protein E8E11_000056, partial [Didymella keratinophila]
EYLVTKCRENKELGPTHPQTLKSMSILAEVLMVIGNWDKAETLQREVADVEKKNFLFRTTLVDILRVKGQWKAAQELGVEVLLEEISKFSSEDEGDEPDEPGHTLLDFSLSIY